MGDCLPCQGRRDQKEALRRERQDPPPPPTVPARLRKADTENADNDRQAAASGKED